jgi:hypothetical protein
VSPFAWKETESFEPTRVRSSSNEPILDRSSFHRTVHDPYPDHQTYSNFGEDGPPDSYVLSLHVTLVSSHLSSGFRAPGPSSPQPRIRLTAAFPPIIGEEAPLLVA